MSVSPHMTQRLRPTLLLLFALAMSTAPDSSFSQQQPKVELVDQPCVPGQAMRVAVFADGRIEFNGRPVAVDQLRNAAAAAVAAGAREVCVHRQNPEAPEPHPNMLVVLESLITTRLPIAFYWDAAFRKRVAFKS